jgi:hypothetical protein
MRIIKGGAGDRPQSCRGEAGGLREYWDGGGGVDLLVEGQGGNRPGVFLMMKTTVARLPALEKEVKRLHSYDVPEFVVLEIAAGSKEYFRWIEECVR